VTHPSESFSILNMLDDSTGLEARRADAAAMQVCTSAAIRKPLARRGLTPSEMLTFSKMPSILPTERPRAQGSSVLSAFPSIRLEMATLVQIDRAESR
jgi:hypothetical protein